MVSACDAALGGGWPPAAALALAVWVSSRLRRRQSLYVAKLSVDVTAKNAVAARHMGMADAQMRAVKIVMQRLVPLSAQAQLPELSQEEVEGLVNGVSIRKEQNSTTRYLATPRCQRQRAGGQAAAARAGIAYSEGARRRSRCCRS